MVFTLRDQTCMKEALTSLRVPMREAPSTLSSTLFSFTGTSSEERPGNISYIYTFFSQYGIYRFMSILLYDFLYSLSASSIIYVFVDYISISFFYIADMNVASVVPSTLHQISLNVI